MKLSSEIIEVLDHLGEKFGIAINWTDENVIPYLQDLGSRYIKYEISTSVFWTILAILMISLSVVFMKAIDCEIDDVDLFFPIIVITIGIPISIIIFQIHDIIRCVCLPEAQIYEYISKFIQ